MQGRSRLHLVLALLPAVTLAGGACSLKSGSVQPRHPLLLGDVGERALRPGTGAFVVDGPAPADTPAANRLRGRIAGAASDVVGKRQVVVGQRRYRMDCSGVARGIYALAGVQLGGSPQRPDENDTSILYRWVQQNGSLRRSHPTVGDLVFFHDTYDQNGDGVRNDPLSHVGVVERVLDDGTVVFVHRVGAGILRYRMNLERPTQRRDPESGRTLNHYLRRAEGGEPARTTAELFAAFGTVVLRGDDAWVASR